MPSFKVGDLVLMEKGKGQGSSPQGPLLTVQFVRSESVICSYVEDRRIYTVELNPVLLEPAPAGYGEMGYSWR